jgi:Domain of unknown function (DUF5753)/Subtilase family/Helix-turn-helix
MHPNQISRHRPRATRPPGRRSRRRPWLAAATLTACLAAAYPAAAAAGGTAAAVPQRPLNCGPPDYFIQCYTPRAYEVAYGVAPLLRQGIDGRGETVVMPELAETPSRSGLTYTDISKDLAAFDSRFGLPPATLRVVNSIARSKTPYLAGSEEVEDTEMVHAIAPGAALDVVLMPQDAASSTADIAAATTRAIRAGVAMHAAVISISGSGGEHSLTPAEVAHLSAALGQARGQHVTVVASSGDTGAVSDQGPPRQVSLPASDPLVLGVGGTTLDATWATGTYHGEMAWNADTEASGGGYSSLFPRPAYQEGVSRIGRMRGVPDVAADADASTARRIGESRAQISRLENGHVVDQNDVMKILDAMGVDGERWTQVVTIAREAGERGWWESTRGMGERQALYANLEAGAATIREYQQTFIPGLLQTPEFVRARTDADATLEPLGGTPEGVLAGRAGRQRMLRRPGAPSYEVIIDELAIRRLAAPPDVVKKQLYQLATAGNGSSAITVRVLPVDARVDSFTVPRCAFSIYTYPDPGDPAVVAIDTVTSDLVLTDPAEVTPYDALYTRLRDAALPPASSLALLTKAATELPDD